MKAIVNVCLKKNILDPGVTVRKASLLGFGVSSLFQPLFAA